MNKNLKVSKSIEITTSDSSKIWDVLTNPDKIKIYLYGTETITDWKVGSPIIFQGNYQGQTYKDKGNVLENKPNQRLKYNYWSGFSGLEDTLENYFIITLSIDEIAENNYRLTWAQEGFKTEQSQQHTEQGLPSMLEQMKELAEA